LGTGFVVYTKIKADSLFFFFQFGFELFNGDHGSYSEAISYEKIMTDYPYFKEVYEKFCNDILSSAEEKYPGLLKRKE